MENAAAAKDKLSRLRLQAALISLVLGFGIFCAKFYAYKLTGSAAVLSDALESVVNVVAAAFALFAVSHAHQPPDRNHPYGHGKIEFIAAVFEGGLVSFAALMIAYSALRALVNGAQPHDLDVGLWIIAASGLLNGALAWFLIWAGKRSHSLALEADGKHILGDFLTSIGILAGLTLVHFTGYAWLDPLIAMGVAAILLFTGVPLVSKAIGGLLDAQDTGLMQKLLASVEAHRFPGIIRLHHARAMRNGRRIHLDGHVVVPEFWPVQLAHDNLDSFVNAVLKNSFHEGEIEFHLDPCRRAYCAACDLADCPVRAKPFTNRPPLTLDELVNPVDITDRHESY